MNNEKELRHRYGWTPAATKAPYSQTNVNLEYKGRDYDAILRAAKRKPVGYWEDAPSGIKFGGGGGKPNPQGADDDLYEPVGTMPVAGDVMRNEDGRTFTCTGVHEEYGRKFGSTDYSKSWMCFELFELGRYRVLKRQPAQ